MTNRASLIGFALAGWVFDFFDLILYSFLLIHIQVDFHIPDTEVALVYSASLAITAVGGICLGYVGDKLGRKPAIMISILIFSVGTLLSGLAWNLESLLVFRIVTGFGIGGEWAAGHTLINESLPAGQKGKASAIIQSGAPIGAALGAVVGGFIAPLIGWRLSFIVTSIPSFLLIILMYFFLNESPHYVIFKAEANDSRIRKDGSKCPVPNGSGYIRLTTNRTLQQLWQVRHSLVLGALLSLWGMMAYWIVFSWTPKYLTKIGFSDNDVGYWMLLTQLGAFIGYLSFGYVAEYTKKFRGTFSMYTAVFAVGVLLFTSGTANQQISLAYFGIFITGLGTGFFSGYGPLYSKLFPFKIRNTSSSWCFNIGRLGAFVAPLLVVSIGAKIGIPGAIATAAIFAVILLGWVFLLPQKDYISTEKSQSMLPATVHLIID